MSTNIQWCDETWNVIVGCSRVSGSPGCARCYAAKAAKSPRLQQFPQYQGVGKWDGTVEFVKSQLIKPLSWKKPKRIFVCSMADLFHANVPDEWIHQVMTVVALSPQHTFQILTKRPERMKEYFSQQSLWIKWYEAAKDFLWDAISEKFGGLINLQQYFIDQPFPLPNVWLGTSTENQQMSNKRIPILLQIPAAVRFLSCEPLLEEIDFRQGGAIQKLISDSYEWELVNEDIQWIVVGGESGPNSRPCHIEWLESIVQQCHAVKTPVFVKQLGANAKFEGQRFKTRDKKGGEIEEFPLHLQVREFPVPVRE
ncbi:MAG: phage Gp37/Gp68 family protein [Nostoc sp. DedQUE08]|uniref:phage Gp37/Gp68 family protein n=1 Tax=Nostoc sp. DedQUE08 TaxID=3075393 RepID=UPI002AD51B52|nr:phage Gp37/Gp68 family protein [Nostoc sp. DedQUE08]MDZ8070418.1 phage Gp37/Gp68 family protein [Nostoc sp. DedQUE08]